MWSRQIRGAIADEDQMNSENMISDFSKVSYLSYGVYKSLVHSANNPISSKEASMSMRGTCCTSLESKKYDFLKI